MGYIKWVYNGIYHLVKKRWQLHILYQCDFIVWEIVEPKSWHSAAMFGYQGVAPNLSKGIQKFRIETTFVLFSEIYHFGAESLWLYIPSQVPDGRCRVHFPRRSHRRNIASNATIANTKWRRWQTWVSSKRIWIMVHYPEQPFQWRPSEVVVIPPDT